MIGFQLLSQEPVEWFISSTQQYRHFVLLEEPRWYKINVQRTWRLHTLVNNFYIINYDEILLHGQLCYSKHRLTVWLWMCECFDRNILSLCINTRSSRKPPEPRRHLIVHSLRSEWHFAFWFALWFSGSKSDFAVSLWHGTNLYFTVVLIRIAWSIGLCKPKWRNPHDLILLRLEDIFSAVFVFYLSCIMFRNSKSYPPRSVVGAHRILADVPWLFSSAVALPILDFPHRYHWMFPKKFPKKFPPLLVEQLVSWLVVVVSFSVREVAVGLSKELLWELPAIRRRSRSEMTTRVDLPMRLVAARTSEKLVYERVSKT